MSNIQKLFGHKQKSGLKIITAIIMLTFAVITFIGCSGVGEYIEDPKLKNTVACAEMNEHDDVVATKYQGNTYYLFQNDYIDMRLDTEDEQVKIGWNDSKLLFYRIYWFADKSEKPLVMFSHSFGIRPYVREDYDYETDVFYLEGTNSELVFSEIVVNDNCLEFVDNNETVWFTMVSKSSDFLVIEQRIFKHQGDWYFCETGAKLSEQLVDLLIENQIIS